MSKQINTLQIDTLYLQLEANLVKLTEGPFFFAWLCLSLQVDVKSSITYCTRNKFTALIASSGHSVCKHSAAAAQRFALVCCSFPVYEGHVRLDSSRRGEEPPVLSSSSLTINLLYGSVRAARSTLTPCPFILQHTHTHIHTGTPPTQHIGHHSVVGMLLTRLSWLSPDAFSELRFSSLLTISVHVFLYWCRSREYTKGSQAALL